jgi:MarR family transcriptional regulator, organic hydroperoxide resistance regulator
MSAETKQTTPWLAEETGRTDPASRAWSLMHWLMISNRARFLAINQEFDLAPQQAIALRILGGGPRPMGELAKYLMCDSSNVTGITDRLEERGLVRRESGEHDRRVKMLVLTEEGEKVRRELTKRMAEPPPWISALPEADQRKLLKILQRAIESEEAEGP